VSFSFIRSFYIVHSDTVLVNMTTAMLIFLAVTANGKWGDYVDIEGTKGL